MLKISKNKQTLLKDGKTFFYLADTCWSAFTNISDEEWDYYLYKRKVQGFNTIQINILPQWDASLTNFNFNPFINNNPRMNMEVAAARVIEAINHVPIRIQEGDGKFNMCEAIEEMIKDGREVGRQEGQNRINQLIILLSKENRGEDIVKAAEDREYQEQLLKEFNL